MVEVTAKSSTQHQSIKAGPILWSSQHDALGYHLVLTCTLPPVILHLDVETLIIFFLNDFLKVLKALNRLKTSEHCGISCLSMSCVPYNPSFLFLSFCKFVVENETRNFGNDKCDVNTGHVSSPAVTICSHFFLCCVCLSPVPGDLC